ncbi:MAG: S8 family serine peptidase [Blastocatellia bacterium]
MSEDPRVEFVEENGVGSVGTTQLDPPWGLDRIDQRDLPLNNSYTYNQTGAGVNAYVIDTGLRTTHLEFGGRAFFAADFANDGLPNNADCTVPPFANGHGTLVAGIVGGTTYGVAKNVSLHKVRVCHCNGDCFTDVIIQGVDWVTGNHVKPAVANMSLAANPSGALDKSVRRSTAAGVTYVTIAGNRTPPQDAINFSPARVTQAITVGATDISDNRASFSNFGSVLDLFAPGVQIPSASSVSDTSTFTADGTSLAAPHVVGAVAQYLQLDPLTCPSAISQVITGNATANKIPNPGTGSPNLLLFVPNPWPAQALFSLSLNGTSASFNVVPVPSTGVSLDITASITVEAWIKTNEFDKQDIIARYNPTASTGTDGGYAIRLLDDNRVRFRLYKNINSIATLDSTVAVPTGGWHHVAGVFNGTQMKIFIDGIQRGSLNSTFTPGTGTSNLRIGIGTDNARPFNGLIDEARVTAAAVYSANSTAQHRLTGVVNTKGLWRFDGQNAKDCADIHNGMLVGGATFSTSVP